MANPTTNFGWVMPTATDLVTDLPADFNVFGQGVDTSLQDLLGGTTGQVLKKNSNTNMDFVWSADGGMTNPMTTTGDTIYSSSGSTPARLGIGTTGQILTVAGGVPTWAAAPGGGKILQVVVGTSTTSVSNSTSTYADTGLSATITPASTGSRILVLVDHGTVYKSANSNQNQLNFRLFRGATQIGFSSAWYTGPAVEIKGYHGIQYVDSPASVSALTYKTQFRNEFNGASVVVISGGAEATTGSIILMEIGA